MKKIIICRGIQGSGKTSWSKQWCSEDPEHRVRINNDDIRNMLGNYWVTSREKLVKNLYVNFLVFAMNLNYDIVIDNMNLNPKTIKEIENMVLLRNKSSDCKYKIEFKDFWTPVKECIRRDSLRPNPIGAKVIKETFNRYRSFIAQEKVKALKQLQQDSNLPKAIICDMDATICLNAIGRPFYGPDAIEQMKDDEPIQEVINLVLAYLYYNNASLIILTGREDTGDCRKVTEQWLKDHSVNPDLVIMRTEGDHSTAIECKKKLYEQHIKDKFNVVLAFEDDSECVKMWRELGIICLQPNEGQF